ncbi:unnamed protein product [Vitrella brassicaformis CCMP3155]|uniref:Uncharacterized protein n=2 Tax=Vitrella brassicaformis TaxID=1169539 RepID=A0A0G4F7P1_VITBC|nr:unnamed protein product [Vitrella brassicaformis CCMP3155]|mmetsp:Transcript_20995/g.51178  ORF Transcript_20995/g.51178 Transcript_20995/m.51178 type:complete len:120 (+) Transcript_20995:1230-1589(+)|eukprot:CEM08696.1 unnamed protein product [Vitrella brassicaformis CCMP3155]
MVNEVDRSSPAAAEISSSDCPPDILEVLRPKSLAELQQAVSDAPKAPPLMVQQIMHFSQLQSECQQRCLERLRQQAEREAALEPSHPVIAEFVGAKFAALEERCFVLCGRRYLSQLPTG